MNIDTMKYYVESGLWNSTRLERLHRTGKITQEDYNTLVECLKDDEHGTN